MMVEAGGTPKSFEFYAEGAPKVDEAVLASGLEASKQWIKESIGLQRQLVASVISTHGPITALAFTPVHDYGDDVFAAVERRRARAVEGGHDRSQGRAQRGDRRGHRPHRRRVGRHLGEPGSFAGREREIREAVRSLTKKLVRKRIVEEGVRIDGRGLSDLRPVSAEVGVLPTAQLWSLPAW